MGQADEDTDFVFLTEWIGILNSEALVFRKQAKNYLYFKGKHLRFLWMQSAILGGGGGGRGAGL